MNCPKCRAYWLLPDFREVSECPFCHYNLQEEQKEPSDFNVMCRRMLSLVQEHGKEIYLDEVLFKVVLAEYFSDKKRLLKLFRLMIDLGGPRRLYEISQEQQESEALGQAEMQREEFISTIVKEHKVPRDFVEEGFFLLYCGLKPMEYQERIIPQESLEFHKKKKGISLGKIMSIPRSKVRIVQDKRDFQIENGVLIKYLGKDPYVIIPPTVTSIGEKAFSWNSDLIHVEFPDSVTSIGDGAFLDCSRLGEVRLPPHLLSIGEEAFFDCNLLSHVNFSPFLEEIGENAFHSCLQLEEIDLPNSLRYMGEGAFYNCISLKEVVVPNQIKVLYKWIFSACRSLDSVKIPPSVEEIDWHAFSHCLSLEKVVIPSTVARIRENAFIYCSNLTEVEVGNPNAFIGNGAFSYTPWGDKSKKR